MKQLILNKSIIPYVVFVVLLVCCTWAVLNALKPVDKKGYQSVIVENGDTLWKIAEANGKGGTKEISQFVKWVEDVNHLQSENIHAGDSLIIPIKKTSQQIASKE